MEERYLIGLAAILVTGLAARWVAWKLHLPSILLLLLGGVAGLLLARLGLPLISAASSGQLDLVMPLQSWVLGMGLMLLIGIIVGLPPALRAMRLRIVDALAGH